MAQVRVQTLSIRGSDISGTGKHRQWFQQGSSAGPNTRESLNFKMLRNMRAINWERRYFAAKLRFRKCWLNKNTTDCCLSLNYQFICFYFKTSVSHLASSAECGRGLSPCKSSVRQTEEQGSERGMKLLEFRPIQSRKSAKGCCNILKSPKWIEWDR